MHDLNTPLSERIAHAEVLGSIPGVALLCTHSEIRIPFLSDEILKPHLSIQALSRGYTGRDTSALEDSFKALLPSSFVFSRNLGMSCCLLSHRFFTDHEKLVPHSRP